jgi:hypothetical protein
LYNTLVALSEPDRPKMCPADFHVTWKLKNWFRILGPKIVLRKRGVG